MNRSLFLVILLTLLSCEIIVGEVLNPIAIIHDLLQYNVAGIPSTHQKTEWNFDPDSGMKRRVQYEKDNGEKGMDLIERLGLGAEFSGP